MYSGLGTVDYAGYVAKYLNRINPATGMYWTNADVARAEGMSLAEIESMLTRAQTANLIAVQYGAPPLTNSQLQVVPSQAVLDQQKAQQEAQPVVVLPGEAPVYQAPATLPQYVGTARVPTVPTEPPPAGAQTLEISGAGKILPWIIGGGILLLML